jgi:hypothetical protein
MDDFLVSYIPTSWTSGNCYIDIVRSFKLYGLLQTIAL